MNKRFFKLNDNGLYDFTPLGRKVSNWILTIAYSVLISVILIRLV